MSIILRLACVLALLSPASRALACGGFFCSQSSPVVQNAERIVFVDNADGTLTAIVEIEYSGPSAAFSWVLPVPGVPEIEVASTEVLDAIDRASLPTFSRSFRGDGCDRGVSCGMRASSDGAAGGFADSGVGGDPVFVRGAGTVGPYDYAVISVDPGEPDPAAVATAWLIDNGYDVSAFGGDVLGVYLEQGLNLLAFRLTKNATAGSIRPVMLTYEGEHPMIPIRPTAVAATNDMGVLVFLYGARRAVPVTYAEIEISDVAIDWNQASTSYLDVVGRAIDEAGGHAFVTERAGANVPPDLADAFRSQLSALDEARVGTELETYMVRELAPTLVRADGFVDALRDGVTEFGTFTPETLADCLTTQCSTPGVVIDENALIAALDTWVVAPVERTEAVIRRRPYMTRLYTMLDAEEMTIDPTFTFAAGLADVSNIHTAVSVTRCVRRDTETTLEVAGVEVRASQLEGVPNPVRVLAYDLYGVQTLMRDRTADLDAAVAAAERRNDSGCAARERRAGGMDLVVGSVLAGATITLVRRRRRRAADTAA